jgi:hypothetical protein
MEFTTGGSGASRTGPGNMLGRIIKLDERTSPFECVQPIFAGLGHGTLPSAGPTHTNTLFRANHHRAAWLRSARGALDRPCHWRSLRAPLCQHPDLRNHSVSCCIIASDRLHNLTVVQISNLFRVSIHADDAIPALLSRESPARVLANVPAWPGHFDIEIDCITAVVNKVA